MLRSQLFLRTALGFYVHFLSSGSHDSLYTGLTAGLRLDPARPQTMTPSQEPRDGSATASSNKVSDRNSKIGNLFPLPSALAAVPDLTAFQNLQLQNEKERQKLKLSRVGESHRVAQQVIPDFSSLDSTR